MEVNLVRTKNPTEGFLKLVPVSLILLIGALYFETVNALIERWTKWDENQSHGLIIIFIFCFFLLRASPIPTSHNSPLVKILSLSGLVISSLIWFITNATNLHIIEQLSLLGIIVFLFSAAFGVAATREHIFLLLLPIFAIPVWDQLTNPLVNLSGFIVGEMVRLIAIPAVIDGNSIFVPDGEIVIADGCSGLRYFTISLAIAYLISYLNGYSLKKLSMMLAIAACIGLVTNWLRIFILVIIGYQTQMQSPLMSDHEYFGWILFALIAFPAIYFAPVVKKLKGQYLKSSTTAPVLFAPLIALCVGPLLNFFVDLNPTPQALNSILSHEYHPTSESKMPIKVQAPYSAKVETAVDDQGVFIQVNRFQRTAASEKLVPYLPRLFDNTVWSLQSESNSNSDTNKLKIQTFRNKHTGTIVAQAQWFEIAGHSTTSYTTAKLLQIPAMLMKKNIFTIYTVQNTCADVTCKKEIENLTVRSNSLAMNTKEN